MNATDVAHTIQLIIAPVVLITACSLVQNAVLLRYASAGQFIRTLALERLNLLRSSEDAFYSERLQEIDRQIPLLIRRHRFLQNTVLVIYGAIAIFLLSMFVIALSVAFDSAAIATIALILFLIGTGILLVGILITALEVRISHHAICYEIGRVTSLRNFSRVNL